MTDRVPDTHFEDRYRSDPDPWRLRDRWYERRKRTLTIAALTRSRYRRAFEPGCALGLLTELLAGRCDELIATDAAPTAAASAARRLADQPHVRVEVGAVPDAWPDGRFDLIVLSEVGYYLSRAGVERLRDRAVSRLTDDGELLAVHYRPDVPEHLITGDVVHDLLRGTTRVTSVVRHTEELFVLDVLRRDGNGTPASTGA